MQPSNQYGMSDRQQAGYYDKTGGSGGGFYGDPNKGNYRGGPEGNYRGGGAYGGEDQRGYNQGMQRLGFPGGGMPPAEGQREYEESNRFGRFGERKDLDLREQRIQADLEYKKGISDLRNQIQLATEKVDPKALSPHHIYLTVSGVIESGECRSEESLQVKFSITSGRDWEHIAGQTEGLSQSASPSSLLINDIVWNFPFEVSFRSQNPMGWPQIVLTIYGPDIFGRSVVKGYGSVHVPTTPGYHERTVYLYRPLPMSWISGLLGYLKGTMAEYQKPEKTIPTGEGREVTRVSSSGKIKIKFQVMERNMKRHGYMV